MSNADGKQLLSQAAAWRAGGAADRCRELACGSSPQATADDPPESWYRCHRAIKPRRRQPPGMRWKPRKQCWAKAQQDLSGAVETASKLEQTPPIYQDQERP